MRPLQLLLAGLLVVASGCARGDEAAPATTATSDHQTVAAAVDGEWATLSGTVASVTGDRFTLDYGRGSIPVEMDDYDWFNENALLVGDEVTVSGRMDEDFFQTRTLEAATVYVRKLNEHFFASSADEEDNFRVFALGVWPRDNEWVSITGNVTAIAGREMTVDAGALEYSVDTTALGYDPFDSEGGEKVNVGERVVVYGRMDDSDLFQGREIDATGISTLSEAA